MTEKNDSLQDKLRALEAVFYKSFRPSLMKLSRL